MAMRMAAAAAVALAAVMGVLAPGAAAQTPTPNCPAAKLVPCSPPYMNTTGTPPDTCCGRLKDAVVVQNDLNRLCDLYATPEMFKAFNISDGSGVAPAAGETPDPDVDAAAQQASSAATPAAATPARRREDDDGLVADGWPAWLLDNVPREALRGVVPKRVADAYEKMEKVGEGSYSSVYRAMERATGRAVALKKVEVNTSEPESVRLMAREIEFQRRLDHPNVMRLEGVAASRRSVYLVFEFVDSDLGSLVFRSGQCLTEPQVPETTLLRTKVCDPSSGLPLRSTRIAAQQLANVPVAGRGEALIVQRLAQLEGKTTAEAKLKYEATFGDDPVDADTEALRKLFPDLARRRGYRA